MSKLNNIVMTLFDMMVMGGKLLISYIRDIGSWIALLWKDDHLTPPKQEDDFIWQGGVTNLHQSRINDTKEESTLQYDEYDDTGRMITYDGVMGEIDWEGDEEMFE